MRNTKGNPSGLNEKILEKNLNPHKEIKSTGKGDIDKHKRECKGILVCNIYSPI